MAPERRNWPRVELKLSAQLRFEDAAELALSETSDVSRDGVFLNMKTPRPIGTRVKLTIEIASSGQRFALEGVVVRQVSDQRSRTGVGIFLTSASPGWVELCAELERCRTGAPVRK